MRFEYFLTVKCLFELLHVLYFKQLLTSLSWVYLCLCNNQVLGTMFRLIVLKKKNFIFTLWFLITPLFSEKKISYWICQPRAFCLFSSYSETPYWCPLVPSIIRCFLDSVWIIQLFWTLLYPLIEAMFHFKCILSVL